MKLQRVQGAFWVWLTLAGTSAAQDQTIIVDQPLQLLLNYYSRVA
jgi:hypothetical protein